MNNKSIKARADELIAYCKPQYIRILIIMTVVGMIPNTFSSSESTIIIFLILSILFTPFKHGYVVTSLKIVRNNFNELSDNDAFTGIKRFKELFFTYFLYELIVCAVLFGLAFLAVIIAVALGGGVENITSILTLTVVLTVAVSVVSMLVGLYGFAFPYLLEKYGYTGMDAIKESFGFIKGHLLDLFKLEFSYLGWAILVAVVQILLSQLFAFLGPLGSVIASLVSGGIALLTYLPQYYVAKAIFFEEIAFKRYHEYTSYQDGSMSDEVKEIEEQGENNV